MLSTLMKYYQHTGQVDSYACYPFDNPNPGNFPQTKNQYFRYELRGIPARIALTIYSLSDHLTDPQNCADKMMLELAQRGEL